MKITILGADLPVSDKVIYATEEASREYINAMKYIPTIATCPDCGTKYIKVNVLIVMNKKL